MKSFYDLDYLYGYLLSVEKIIGRRQKFAKSGTENKHENDITTIDDFLYDYYNKQDKSEIDEDIDRFINGY